MAKLTIPEVSERFAKYHANHLGWGIFHIILEEGNVKKLQVTHFLEDVFSSGTPEEIELATLMLKLSQTQLLKLSTLPY